MDDIDITTHDEYLAWQMIVEARDDQALMAEIAMIDMMDDTAIEDELFMRALIEHERHNWVAPKIKWQKYGF